MKSHTPRFTAPARAVTMLLIGMTLAWATPAPAQGLFVVSQANEKILEYDETNGSFLSTFVDPILTGFQVPGGISIHPSTGTLYVSSTGTGEIWTYTTSTGVVITPAVATGLISPGGTDFDATGAHLYFLAAETGLSTGTDAILDLTVSSGNVSTVATDASASLTAVAVNGSNLFVTDVVNNRVTRYPTSGGGGTVVVTGLSQPGGIVFSSPSQMLVANMGTDEVLRYDLVTGSWVFDQVVMASTAGVDGPTGLAIAPDGTLTVAGQFSSNVVSVNLSTLAVTPLVASGAGGLSAPGEVAWSGSTLLVSSLSTNSVIYYDNTGTSTGVIAKGLSSPAESGMTFTPAGNLIVGSQADNDLVEYDGQGGAVIRKYFDACPTSFAAPFDQVVGPDGNVYVSCPASNGIFRFNGATGDPMGFFITGAQGLVNPQGLAFGPNGNLFVGAAFPDFDIKEFNGTTGAFVGVFVDSNGNTGMDPITPWDITFHNGNLFVSSRVLDDVKEFNGTTGAFVQTFVTAGSGGLDGPTGIAFGADGDLYVASFENDSIKRYDGSNGNYIEDFVIAGSGGLDDPIDIGFQPAGAGGGSVPALSAPGMIAFLLLAALLGARRTRPARTRSTAREKD